MTNKPPAGSDPIAARARVSPELSQRWDAVYASAPAWEIGRPQAAFVAAAEKGQLHGRLIDIGCGTGETTLLAAAHGADALGIDPSQRAIVLARALAAERGLRAQFQVADVFNLEGTDQPFDVAIDSGTFHLFNRAEQVAYAENLHRAIGAGGRLYLLCARANGAACGWGPPGLSQADLAEVFSEGWSIIDIEPAEYEVTEQAPVDSVAAWFATIERH